MAILPSTAFTESANTMTSKHNRCIAKLKEGALYTLTIHYITHQHFAATAVNNDVEKALQVATSVVHFVKPMLIITD